jgi:hypothetical protein
MVENGSGFQLKQEGKGINQRREVKYVAWQEYIL